MVGGENGGAAELPCTTTHLTAVAATGDDDGGGGATQLEIAGDG